MITDLIPDRALTISEVAQRTGISEAALRMWEKRYHWPIPDRNTTGYRTYSTALVEDLERVADLLKRGYAIGEIILDGAPHWPTELVARPSRPAFDFSRIPPPDTDAGKRVRARLEDALVKGDAGTIARLKAELPLLHPRDRGPAVLDVLKAAGHSA
jgi:hypothetical protein